MKCALCECENKDFGYEVFDYENNPICDACADQAIDPYPDRIYPTADND